MPNDKFDSLFSDFEREPLDEEPQSPSKPILDEFEAEGSAVLQKSVRNAQKKNPEAQAKVVDLANRHNLPANVVEKKQGEIEQRDRFQDVDFERLQKDSPGLAKWLQHQKNADIASDDLDNLGFFEGIFKGLGETLPRSFGQGVRGVRTALIDSLSDEQTTEEIAPGTTMSAGMWPIAKDLMRRGLMATEDVDEQEFQEILEGTKQNTLAETERINEEIGDLTPEGLSTLQQGVRAGINSLFEQAPGFAMTLATRSATPMLSTIGVQTWGRSYGDARAKGKTPAEAQRVAGVDAAIEIGTELLPAKILADIMGPAHKGKTWRKFTEFLMAEVPGEQVAEFLQSANQVVNQLDEEIKPGMPLGEMAEIQAQRQAVAFWATLVAGGTQVGVASGVSRLARTDTTDKVEQRVNDRLGQAESEQAAIDQIVTLSQEMKTQGRSREAMSELVDNWRDQYDYDGQVYIDAQAFQDIADEGGFDMENPTVVKSLEQVSEALTRGGDVEIGIEDLLIDVIPSAAFETLRPHIRLRPDSLSSAELENAAPVRDEMLRTMLDEANQNAEIKQQSDDIWAEVTDQLVQTGRMSTRSARMSAALYPAYVTTAVARLREKGVETTPRQVFESLGFRVEAAPAVEQQTLEQAVEQIEVEERQQAEQKGLDMSPEAREQRAQEMGFDTGTVYFHGTDRAQRLAESGEFRQGRGVGGPIFFSPVPEEAAEFTNQDAEAFEFNQVGGGEVSPGIFPVRLKAENPFNFRNPDHREQLLEAIELPDEARDDFEQDLANGEFEVLEDPQVIQFMRDNGFDGFFVTEGLRTGTGAVNIAVFEPNQIRSVNAAFDPEFEASGDILQQEGVTPEQQRRVTQTEEFQSWFGDSKVVNENGEPLVVYHGTHGDFVFDKAKRQVWLSSDPDVAHHYAGFNQQATMPLYAKIENPLDTRSAEEVKAVLREAGWSDEKIANVEESLGIDEQYSWKWIQDGKGVVEALELAGYDGAKVFDDYANVDSDSPLYDEQGMGTFDHQSWVAFRPEQIKSATGNRGTFDPADPNILRQEGETPRGQFQVIDNERVIRLIEGASDLTTFLHESAHLFMDFETQLAEQYGVDETQQAMLDWLEASSFAELDPSTDAGRAKQEKFADAFEVYLLEGKAPNTGLREAFRNFKQWLTEVYKTVIRSDQSIEGKPRINQEIRDIFDRLLATEEEIAAVNAEMQFGETFEDDVPRGTSPAKARAKETLEQKLLKQLQRRTENWWKEEAAQVQESVIEELKQTPTYRAERFMQGEPKIDSLTTQRADRQKAGELLGFREPKKSTKKGADPEFDSLLVAIAKLGGINQEVAEAEGIDPENWRGRNAKTINQPVFGKRIFVKQGGMSLGGILERLQENNYVREDSTNALLNLIDEELRGNPQYSTDANFEAIFGPEFDESAPPTMPRRLRGLTQENGLDPDEIASLTGFDNGLEMLKAISESKTLEEAAREETERRMVAEHGDILNDGTLEEEARLAVHNEERGRQLLAQLRVLNRRANRQSALDRNALKEAAKSTVRNLTVAQLQGGIVSRYHRAEVKAAVQARQLEQEGDLDGAARAKAQQALNFYLYGEAREARDKVERQRRHMSEVQKRKYDPKQVDPVYIQHLKRYAAAFEFRRNADAMQRKDRLVNVALWVRDQETTDDQYKPEIIDPQLETVMQAQRENRLRDVELKYYKDMTVDELEAVYKMAQHLRFIGGKLAESEKAKRAEQHARVAGVILENFKNRKRPIEGSRREAIEKAAQGYASEILLHAESQLRRLDGFQDLGPVFRAVKSPIDQAVSDVLIPMQQQAGDDFVALYDKYFTTKEMEGMHKQRDVNGRSYSTWQLISLGLNVGNASSRKAVMDQVIDGQPVFATEQELERTLAGLDKKHWDFIQDVWDYLDTYKIEMGKIDRKLTGTSPRWVDPQPVHTPHGTYRGGYYPLKYDATESMRVSEEQINEMMKSVTLGRFAKAHTPDGMLKERVGSGGRPIRLDTMVLHQHVNQAIQYIALAEPVSEVQALLSSAEVREAMEATGNVSVLKALDVWLKDVAVGEVVSGDVVSRGLRQIRTGFSASVLGYNVGTMLLQPLGVLQSMPVVGYRNMLKGIGQVLRNPMQTFEQIQSVSSFMRERAVTWNKDMRDTMQILARDPTKRALPERVFGKTFLNHLFTGIVFTQRYVDTATWLAAYEKGKSENPDWTEADLIQFADGSVRRSQASGIFADRTPIERGTISDNVRQAEFVRIWSTLGSYFFAKGNLAVELTRKTNFKSPAQASKYVADLMVLFAIEAIIVETMLRGMGPDEDDEETWAGFATKTTGLTALGSFPFFREIGSELQGFRGGSAVATAAERGGRAATAVENILAGEGDVGDFKAINNLGGIIFKYPSSMINRVVDSAVKDSQGEDIGPVDYLIYREKDE